MNMKSLKFVACWSLLIGYYLFMAAYLYGLQTDRLTKISVIDNPQTVQHGKQ